MILVVSGILIVIASRMLERVVVGCSGRNRASEKIATRIPIHTAVGTIIGGSVQEMQNPPISSYDRHKALRSRMLQPEQVSNPESKRTRARRFAENPNGRQKC
jgi:hypothetical protein